MYKIFYIWTNIIAVFFKEMLTEQKFNLRDERLWSISYGRLKNVFDVSEYTE